MRFEKTALWMASFLMLAVNSSLVGCNSEEPPPPSDNLLVLPPPPSQNSAPLIPSVSYSATTLTLGQSVDVTVAASDPDGNLADVRFYANGVLLSTGSVPPFTYTWTPDFVGIHTFGVLAGDTAGATTWSVSQSITVNAAAPANHSPSVSIAGLSTGPIFYAGARIPLSVTATDDDGTIAKVEYYDGATLLAEVTSEPFAFTFEPSSTGTHSITAKAYDDDGAIATSGAVPITVTALTGALDTDFSGTGYKIDADSGGVSGGMDMANAVVPQPLGGFYVIGRTQGGSNHNLIVLSYSASGSLSTGFAGSGKVIHNGAGNGNDEGWSGALQSDGKLVVVGASFNGTTSDMAVWRFNWNGSLDTDFGGGDGIVLHDNAAGAGAPGTDVARGVAIQPDGKIVVVGYSWNGSNSDMAVWRLNADGTLDSSFGGGDGVFTNAGAAGGTGADVATDVAVQSDGKIVVSGYSDNASGNSDMVVWRLTTVGALDGTFSGDGVFSHGGAAGGIGGNDLGLGIAIQKSDGKIVVAGSSVGAAQSDAAIWRLTTAGGLDTTFNSTGYTTRNGLAGGNQTDAATDVQLLADGTMVLTGYSYSAGGLYWDMFVMKLTDAGAPDSTFGGGDGIFTHANAAGGADDDDGGNACAISADGQIVVAGTSRSNASIEIATWVIK